MPEASGRSDMSGRGLDGRALRRVLAIGLGLLTKYGYALFLGAAVAAMLTLPAFRRLERDLDFPDAPFHGDAGPLPLQRPPPPRGRSPRQSPQMGAPRDDRG